MSAFPSVVPSDWHCNRKCSILIAGGEVRWCLVCWWDADAEEAAHSNRNSQIALLLLWQRNIGILLNMNTSPHLTSYTFNKAGYTAEMGNIDILRLVTEYWIYILCININNNTNLLETWGKLPSSLWVESMPHVYNYNTLNIMTFKTSWKCGFIIQTELAIYWDIRCL